MGKMHIACTIQIYLTNTVFQECISANLFYRISNIIRCILLLILGLEGLPIALYFIKIRESNRDLIDTRCNMACSINSVFSLNEIKI